MGKREGLSGTKMIGPTDNEGVRSQALRKIVERHTDEQERLEPEPVEQV